MTCRPFDSPAGASSSACSRQPRGQEQAVADRGFPQVSVESSLSGKAWRNAGISGREPGSTSGSLHGVGDLFTALRRQGLIADELHPQLATYEAIPLAGPPSCCGERSSPRSKARSIAAMKSAFMSASCSRGHPPFCSKFSRTPAALRVRLFAPPFK